MDLKLKDNSQLTIPIVNRVEYIETSGYPYINTGITLPEYFGNNTAGSFIIDAIIEILDTTTNNSVIYRGLNTQTSRPWFRLDYTTASENNCIIYNGTTSSGNYLTTKLEGRTHIRQACTSRSANTNYVEINGVKTYTAAVNTGHTNVPNFVLFQSGDCRTKIWSYKIYKAGTLVRDYIPVISVESGHIGEAALYDLVNNKYYYSASTGTFTASHSQGLHDIITSAYVKDCPNVSGINLLRSCINLNRVRLDIGTQSGTVAELYKYAAYSGFNDAYENQTKPRIIGTWTITDYWTNDELSYFQSAFDGLTISYDSSKNVDTLLENGDLAIQTLDSTKDGYNPAAAIRLNAKSYGAVVQIPIIDGEGRFFITKSDIAAITTLPVDLFRNTATVVDTNSIVTDDNSATYDFETFDEFKYFTGITAITAGSSSTSTGAFGGCSALESITILSSITTVGSYSFYGCASIKNLVLPTDIDITALQGCGSGLGVCIVKGNVSGARDIYSNKFNSYIIYGNLTIGSRMGLTTYSAVKSVRINGTVTGGGVGITVSNNNQLKFIELSSTWTSYLIYQSYIPSSFLVHLGYNGIANASASIGNSSTPWSKVTAVYVGDGSSRANDESVLAIYNADSTWSTYSTKLSTWYDYNGEYKWYYVFDNLTDCTNTNPVVWPFITRKDSYETTIVADEGYTLDSVQVLMYMNRDDAPTEETPTDITSSVYDSSTGAIVIENVFGNVEIIATATANA